AGTQGPPGSQSSRYAALNPMAAPGSSAAAHVASARVPAQAQALAQTPAESRLRASAQVSYFHTDPSGLPEEVTDEAGEVRWRASWRTWGSALEERWEAVRIDGSAIPAVQQRHRNEDTLEQNLRLQGQYLDRETGLHYNTFRYYDPDVGRFISPDPIGLAGGLNLQRYAPNPISWIDPSGYSSFDPFAVGEITPFPSDIHFGQNRIAPNFSSIASQANDSIAGRPVLDVAADIKSGRIHPDEFVISYTIDPNSGKAVTLNNRGLAALAEGGKMPSNAVLVPYEKVPPHLVSDIKNRALSKTISITLNKDGSGLVKKVSC
ncbi:RHS repeat-associated core domain-containing protein, partial [Paracidovorax avenae]|uniref:RHS repeat-associated core domain-containing protein n=1 Tax=Paracidovorax avenae TaxID=80867 RepID=UPI001F2374CD